MLDNHGRQIDYLRISITDRCNLRCLYCMPEGGVVSLRHEDILSYEEIVRLARVMSGLGIRHIRLTGGEPMARKGCLELVRALRALPGIESVAMTSNGFLLSGRVREAARAGLSSLNLSMDSLQAETFARMTRGGDVGTVLGVLREAVEAGLNTKVNAVPLRGFNEGDLVELAALARELPVCVRFIELMPIGCARELRPVPRREVMALLADAFGGLKPDAGSYGHGPAVYWKPEGFAGSLGTISALSHEFCERCNRVRLTADGQLKLCLNHTDGLDLRALLRGGADDAQLEAAIHGAIARKPARHGFEARPTDVETRRMNEIGG